MDLSGETGAILRWERSTDAFVSDVTDIGFAGSSSITDTPPTAGTFDYRAVIQNGTCPEANSTSLSITVNALPVVTFTGLSTSHCIDEAPVILTGSEIPNGTFSGPGITDNGDGTATFDPSVAGLAGHSITYSFTDLNGCTGANVQPTTVVPLPTVSFSGLLAIYCFEDTPSTLTGSPLGPPGVWTTTAPGGITDNGDGTATFTPSAVTAGIWDVTYTYTDGNGCINFDTQSALVHPQTIPTIAGPLVVCLTSPTQNYLTDAGQSGYSWSIAPATNTIDTDPTLDAVTVTWSESGTLTVLYTDANSCTVSNSIAVSVFTATPAPLVTSPVNICLGDPQPSLVIDNFSGQTVSWYADAGLFGLLSNSHPYIPTPTEIDTSVPGTTSFFVTQAVPGCGVSAPAQIDVIVNNPSNAGTDATVNTCDTETTINLFDQLGGAPDPGGSWTDDDGSGALVGVIFNPSVAGAGTFNFTYDTSNTGCPGTLAIVTVNVEAQPNAGDNSVEACVADTSFDLFLVLGGSPDPGGTWNDDDATGALTGAIFDPSLVGNGTYNFTYSFIGLVVCNDVSATVTVTVGIFSPPPVNDGPSEICVGDSPPVLNAIGSNVKWYADVQLLTLLATGNTYTPGAELDTSVPGIKQYYLTQDVGCGESTADPYDVNVLGASNLPSINPLPDLCLNDPIPQLVAIGTNIIWHSDAAASDTLATGNVFIPNPSQLDTDVIGMTSFFATQDTDCSRSTTTEAIVNVINCVGSCFTQNTITGEATCLNNDGTISFNLDGNEVLPVTFKIFELSGTDTVFQLTQSGNFFDSLSNTTYDYEIVDSQGCAETGQVTVPKRLSTLDATISLATPINCLGELAVYDVVVVSGGSSPYEYSTDGGANWQALIGTQIILPVGDHNVFVRDDSLDPCPYDGGIITIDEPIGITYTILEPSESFPERASGTITVTDVAGGVPGYEIQAELITPTSSYPGQSYLLPFTPIPFVTELGKHEVVLEDLFAGIYEIQIRDTNGCIEDVFYQGLDPEVPLDDDLFIPNVFTPNSDGTNDFFFIRNLPDDTDTRLTVTNKFGKQVYGSTSYKNDWGGEDLPDGVYYYVVVITVEGQEIDYNGWVEIWSGL
jgi:gliding motility-associated-like protein